jgi:hypothetical protein
MAQPTRNVLRRMHRPAARARIRIARGAVAVLLAGGVAASAAFADPSVTGTAVIGPFVGHDAAVHRDNLSPRIAFYGTDLGFSYEHRGRLEFLFGDSWATEAYSPIQASTGGRFDDAYGSIDLAEWSDPARIEPGRVPPVRLGQGAGTTEAQALDPGHAMDLGKTPMGGFSNGAREFGIFNLTKPRACRRGADCGAGLDCDTGLGYAGARPDVEESLTLACVDGDPGCNAETIEGGEGASGFCTDRTSTIWADTPAGRVSGVALAQRIALRATDDRRRYTEGHTWLTNKFVNMTVRTVAAFAPHSAPAAIAPDFRPAHGAGAAQRVFLWGRPGFVGVAAKERTLGVYFAYVDMPSGPGFDWRPQFYAGANPDGMPRFSAHERDAVALDLDADEPGVQAREVHDVVNQVSVAWVPQLGKWLMFYGGGISRLAQPALPLCGVLQVFAGRDCTSVVIGNGAVRMRSAAAPWGPWSAPQDVVVGGDPSLAGSGLYGVGGVLHHPDCRLPGCATHSRTPQYAAGEYGFLYSANIIEQWITPAGPGVDVLWNASTWDPYRVVLFRTRIEP